ncbi:hypothetical protein PQX77_001623 [Marasmius sp. AFHP31]|nr:hypothetical protein PQX77_001623 [Marasmius sp. AFHP31]
MHNRPLPDLEEEWKKWTVDDLMALAEASEKYGILIALQVITKGLKAKAKDMSNDDLLKVLLLKVVRLDTTDIEEFARRTLRIPEKEVLMKFRSHTDVFWVWASISDFTCFRLEWKPWRGQYVEALRKQDFTHRSGAECPGFSTYLNNIESLIRKLADDFPTIEHYQQAENILSGLPMGKKCDNVYCDVLPRWRANITAVLSRQPRWTDYMNRLTQ